MRRKLILNGIFFAFLFYGLILSQSDVRIIAEQLQPKNSAGWYDYRGAINVHSSQGLGSGTWQQIVQAGQDADLDFLILTEFNDFGPRMADGYHRKLLVINSAEYSYLDSRIIFCSTLNGDEPQSLSQTQVFLADLLSQKPGESAEQLLILAHPFKQGYSWSGDYPPGLDGLEVVNLKSIWQGAWNSAKISFVWSVFIYPFNSHLAFLRLYYEPEQELQLWDKLNSSHLTLGFAGAEATARTAAVGPFEFKFPSYQTSFSLVSNHLLLKSELTGETESDRRKVLQGLMAGQFYFSLDLLGNPKGFTVAVSDQNAEHPLGAIIKYRDGQKLKIHLPSVPTVPYEIAVLKDGQHIMSANSQDAEMYLQGPGSYRVVVRVFRNLSLFDGQHWISWIYTNPIRVL